jgi:hypothetical protein
VCREDLPGLRFQHGHRISLIRHVRLDRAGDEHPIDAVVNRNAVRIQDERGCIGRADRLDRPIGLCIPHHDIARTHAGEKPGLVIFRDDQILIDLAIRDIDRAQTIRKPGEIYGKQNALPQGRDVRLALVAVEKDVMGDEIGREGNIHQDFPEVR